MILVGIFALFILMLAQFLLLTNRVQITVACLIIISLISIFISPFYEVISPFGSEIVWLLFSTFIISGAIYQVGLAKRFSLLLLVRSKGKSNRLLLLFLIVTILMTFIIPTNVGRTTLLIPIAMGIIKVYERFSNDKNMAKVLFISLNIAIVMGGAIIITGANSSIYALEIISENSTLNWHYLFWFSVFGPPILLFISGFFVILLSKFPLSDKASDKILKYIRKEIKEISSVSKNEVKVLLVLFCMIIMWVFEPFHHYSIAEVGFFGALLLLLPGIGVLSWSEAKNYIDWDLFILFGTSLAISQMLIQTNAFDYMIQFINNFSFNTNDIITSLIIILLSVILRIFFVNTLGYISVALPLSLSVANALDINSVWVAVLVFLCGSAVFFLPFQSPTSILTYTHKYYTTKEFFNTGIYSAILWIIILVITTEFYWPLLGITVN